MIVKLGPCLNNQQCICQDQSHTCILLLCTIFYTAHGTLKKNSHQALNITKNSIEFSVMKGSLLNNEIYNAHMKT